LAGPAHAANIAEKDRQQAHPMIGNDTCRIDHQHDPAQDQINAKRHRHSPPNYLSAKLCRVIGKRNGIAPKAALGHGARHD
jgi:hypothetical protein